MSGIFISYRREDASGWAGRLAADLRREFPENLVFQDIASIDIGEDFLEAIRRALPRCAVVIVMVGPHWLDLCDEAGQRRLDDPEDWVRLEVHESLRTPGLRVVPVLVGQARMPKSAELPEALRPLARRNAHEITDKRWDYDVSELVKGLRRIGTLAAAAQAPMPAASQNPPANGQAEPAAAAPAETAPAPGAKFRDAPDAPEMVVIPAGEFMMGSPKNEAGRSEDEGPQHQVRLANPFALGRFAVTVGEFRLFAEDSGYETEAERNPGEGIRVWTGKEWTWSAGKSWRDPGFAQDDSHPVVGISWQDAQAYGAWLSGRTGKTYRLPSEAEWEYAARAGTTSRYPWGDEPGSNRANFRDSGSRWSGKGTAPVGSFKPNAFELHDMIGNVWEWTQDCWNGSYKGAPADGRPWESGDCGRRVVRGGSWVDGPDVARSADRVRSEPGDRGGNLGFRLARTL